MILPTFKLVCLPNCLASRASWHLSGFLSLSLAHTLHTAILVVSCTRCLLFMHLLPACFSAPRGSSPKLNCKMSLSYKGVRAFDKKQKQREKPLSLPCDKLSGRLRAFLLWSFTHHFSWLMTEHSPHIMSNYTTWNWNFTGINIFIATKCCCCFYSYSYFFFLVFSYLFTGASRLIRKQAGTNWVEFLVSC